MKRFRGSHFAVGIMAVVSVVGLASHVNANAPAGRYVVPGDGTVYDTMTKLTWQQGVAQTTVAPFVNTTLQWTAANSYCQNGGPGVGSGNWRLPSVKELETIFDETSLTSPMDPTAFPNTPTGTFWSGSAVPATLNQYWYVNFAGYGNSSTSVGTAALSVRCVF